MRSAARPRRRLMLALLASASSGALALGLAACASDSPAPTPTSTPTADAPIFASDEEALAAAEDAFLAYIAIDADVGASGGERPERLREFVAEPYASELIAEFASMKEHGFRTTGKNTAENFRLVKYDSSSEPEVIQVYVCGGAGDTRIFDSSGADITPARTQSLYPLIITFEATKTSVLTSASDLWTGDDFCV